PAGRGCCRRSREGLHAAADGGDSDQAPGPGRAAVSSGLAVTREAGLRKARDPGGYGPTHTGESPSLSAAAISAGLRDVRAAGLPGSDDSAGGEHDPGQLRVNDVAVRPTGRAARADDFTGVHVERLAGR